MELNTLKALNEAAAGLTPEEMELTSKYIAGMKYTKRHPEDTAAAQILATINGITAGDRPGTLQDVAELTQQLAAITERTQSNGNQERL